MFLQFQSYADKILLGMNLPGPFRDFLVEKCKHRPSESKHCRKSDFSDEEPPKNCHQEENRKERRMSNKKKAFNETLWKTEAMNLECNSRMAS